MSLTEAEHVFGGVHEEALNDVILGFCQARPRLLNYGSPAFVPVTTVSATAMPSITFPGIVGGIDWAIAFAIPVVDLHAQTDPLPPELSLGSGQFSLRTAVKLCLDCKRQRDIPKQPDGKDGPGESGKPHPEEQPKDPPRPAEEAMCAEIGVFAIGHLELQIGSGGPDSVRVRIDAVELVDVTPDGLESVLECLIRMVLDAALQAMVLPLEALRAGAFTITLQRGPEVEDDQIKIYGDV